MKRQTAVQAKEPAPSKESEASWLHHASACPVAEQESFLGNTSVKFAYDLTQMPIRPSTQSVDGRASQTYSTSSQHYPAREISHSSPPRVQAKLKISQPGDEYEQEADRVAEQVMGMPEPQMQRKGCPSCKEEDEDKSLRAKSVDSAGNVQAVDHPLIQSVLSSPSQQMDAATRSFMELRFGQDFSGVRVHADGKAVESARVLNARAYTVGRDVVFGEGQYASGTGEGRKLMAHELVHVRQQEGSHSVVHRQTGFKQESDAIIATINSSKPDWNTAYDLLNKQWMKAMLNIMDILSLNKIDELISKAGDAQKSTLIGEGGKNRVLAAAFAVKSTKEKNMKSTDIDMAIQVSLTILINQRREIIAYLSSRLNSAKILKKELNKPLMGYVASGYDFSDRFLRHSNKLGFNIEPAATSLPTTPWGEENEDPDTQETSTTATSENSFEKSDIVFFSGHQYAQYRRPGLFTNDSSDKTFNIGAISKKINKVRLIVSTSCATICKDTAQIFLDKFPNALIIGYRFSAPTRGDILSKTFSDGLVAQGSIDLSSESGLNIIRNIWRKKSVTGDSKERQPGMLYKNDIEYYNEKGIWKTAKADSEENKCHYH